MSLGIVIKQKYSVLAKRLSGKYNKLWVAAEVFLFVLVGAAVDLRYAAAAGIFAVLLIICALAFRMSGVAMSLIKTKLTRQEKLFCMMAYLRTDCVDSRSVIDSHYCTIWRNLYR